MGNLQFVVDFGSISLLVIIDYPLDRQRPAAAREQLEWYSSYRYIGYLERTYLFKA